MIELLACIGLVAILKYSPLLAWLRTGLAKVTKMEHWFQCAMCTGFWVGMGVSLIVRSTERGIRWVWIPFASAALCWVVDSLVDLAQVAANKIEKPD